MDLVYMPELLTYGSFRAPVYRDYEQPWNRDYYGKSSENKLTRYQQEQLQQQLRASSQKEHCHLCKESKRRSLGAYIRGKSRSISCSEIHEEEEEEENEAGVEDEIDEKITAKDESNKTDKAHGNINQIKLKIMNKFTSSTATK